MNERDNQAIDVNYGLVDGINAHFAAVKPTAMPKVLQQTRQTMQRGTLADFMHVPASGYVPGKIGEYRDFTRAATALFPTEALDHMKPVGLAAVTSVAYDPGDIVGSVLQAVNVAHKAMRDTRMAEVNAASQEVYKKDVASTRLPLVEHVAFSFEGASEGAALVGMAFASILEVASDPRIVRTAIARADNIVTRLTTLNIAPQKVLDMLIKYEVNPFQAKEAYTMPVVGLRSDVVAHLQSMGDVYREEVAQGNMERRAAAIFQRVIAITPSSWFTETGRTDDEIKTEAIKRYAILLSTYGETEGVLENLQGNKELANNPVGKILSYTLDTLGNLARYEKFPEAKQTLNCPARHAQILLPWFSMWGGILSDWYAKEQIK